MLQKPLLAPTDTPASNPKFFENLQYPLLVSPKYDGIRCLTLGGRGLSRTLKLLPSAQLQAAIADNPDLHNMDTEVVIGEPTDEGVYNRTSSFIMSQDKPAEDLRIYILDCVRPETLGEPFYKRLDSVSPDHGSDSNHNLFWEKAPQLLIESYEELREMEERFVAKGYEGVMLRNPLGRYKQNRATYRDNIIYKLKRFEDSEGVLVRLEEAMTNLNTLERDERGYAKRSTAQAGLSPAGRVGRFVLAFEEDYINVAPGNFTHDQLVKIWENPSRYLGRLVKFRYMRYGMKDKPRHPRALGFRDPSFDI